MLANKILASGGATGDVVYPEDVFSTFTYTGAPTSQTINNGINLLNDGGMVWTKCRTAAWAPDLIDTHRGSSFRLSTAEQTQSYAVEPPAPTFLSNGYTTGGSYRFNSNQQQYVSWTFKKQKKFFDIVEWTGDGNATKTITHGLECSPGLITIKATNTLSNWYTWHRSEPTKGAILELNAAFEVGYCPFQGEVTDTQFTVTTANNQLGNTYIAYIFAHDTDVDSNIKCGDFTVGSIVDLGFEPQWLLIKSKLTGEWYIIDTDRQMAAYGYSFLFANSGATEQLIFTLSTLVPTPNGFSSIADSNINGDCVYIAIRKARRPVKTGTDVLSVKTYDALYYFAEVNHDINFDLEINKNLREDSPYLWMDRIRSLQGYSLKSSDSSAGIIHWYNYWRQVANRKMKAVAQFDAWWATGNTSVPATHSSIAFKRSSGVFDIVHYTGTSNVTTGASVVNIKHSLNALPELIILKNWGNDDSTISWPVVSSHINGMLFLNSNQTEMTTGIGIGAEYDKFLYAGGTGLTTRDTFFVGNTTYQPPNTLYGNTLGQRYVAYLFATYPGISKVGSYIGNGTAQTLDCGFVTGSRFIIIKRVDAAGDWYIWDSARGLGTGNDPHIALNLMAPQVASDDSIDLVPVGFGVKQTASTNINVNGSKYLYLSFS